MFGILDSSITPPAGEPIRDGACPVDISPIHKFIRISATRGGGAIVIIERGLTNIVHIGTDDRGRARRSVPHALGHVGRTRWAWGALARTHVQELTGSPDEAGVHESHDSGMAFAAKPESKKSRP